MYNKNSEIKSGAKMRPSKTLKTTAEKAVAAGAPEFSYGNNGSKYHVHNPTTGQQITKKVLTFFPVTVDGVECKIYKAQG